MAREAWTDHRLDDLNKRVGDLDSRMESGFSEMREEFRAVRGEIAALNRTIHQFAFAMIGTVFLGYVGTIGAILALT